MKVSQKKPEFQPIVITVETAEELRSLLILCGQVLSLTESQPDGDLARFAKHLHHSIATR